jgi:hypothetical protein
VKGNHLGRVIIGDVTGDLLSIFSIPFPVLTQPLLNTLGLPLQAFDLFFSTRSPSKRPRPRWFIVSFVLPLMLMQKLLHFGRNPPRAHKPPGVGKQDNLQIRKQQSGKAKMKGVCGRYILMGCGME